VDVAHQFQQVAVLFADNRLVAILKKMSAAPVPFVEADGVAGEQTPHELLEG